MILLQKLHQLAFSFYPSHGTSFELANTNHLLEVNCKNIQKYIPGINVMPVGKEIFRLGKYKFQFGS